MNSAQQETVSAVRSYWNTHTLGLQYMKDKTLQPGTAEFFAHIRPWMNPYKFPWIMARIEREATLLRGKHVLEIGCGMGFDSLEFLKRGVRVTATDLTENAVELTRRHFDLEQVAAESVHTENALNLSFADDTFDAVWSNGVLHHTPDTRRAIQEVRRVLKPGGRAVISHFYRRPSWMYIVCRLGQEPIEHDQEDPPVSEFYRDEEILDCFRGFKILEAVHEHHRALPVAKSGLKAGLYTYGFRPLYNLLPEWVALKFAYKLSVTAIKV